MAAGPPPEFGYDGQGRLTAVTNALQQVTLYQYDEAGNQTNQVDESSGSHLNIRQLT
jgi:YD repeat-containing protein